MQETDRTSLVVDWFSQELVSPLPGGTCASANPGCMMLGQTLSGARSTCTKPTSASSTVPVG